MAVGTSPRTGFVHVNDAMAKSAATRSSSSRASSSQLWTPNSNEYLKRWVSSAARRPSKGERRRYVDEIAIRCKGRRGALDGGALVLRARRGHGASARLRRRASDRRRQPGSMEGQATLLEELQELANIGHGTIDPFTVDGRWTAQLAKIHEVGPIKDLREALSTSVRPRAVLAASLDKGPGDAPARLHRGAHQNTARKREVAQHQHLGGRRARRGGPYSRDGGDITWKKKTELALAANQAQVQSLLDNLPISSPARSRESCARTCNARLEQLKGVGPGELSGKVLDGAMVLEGGPSVAGDPWRALAHLRGDGHRELVETLTAPIHDAEEDGRDPRYRARHHRRSGRGGAAPRGSEDGGDWPSRGRVAHDFSNLLSVILSYTNLAIEVLPPAELQADLAGSWPPVSAARV